MTTDHPLGSLTSRRDPLATSLRYGESKVGMTHLTLCHRILGHALLFLEARFEVGRFCRGAGGSAVGRGAQVPHGPRGRGPQFAGRVQGPVGVAQHFAGEKGDVGLAVADAVVGLDGIGDQADRAGEDIEDSVLNSLPEVFQTGLGQWQERG